MITRYVSDKVRFIGGSLRQPGIPFSMEKLSAKKTPKGLKELKLTPAEKKALEKEAEAAKAKAEQDVEEISLVTSAPVENFLEEDKNPQKSGDVETL